MNKIFSILLITILVICTIALTSCQPDQPDQPEPPVVQEHVHTFEDTVIPQTCSAHGYTHHVCSECGYENYDSFVEPDGVTHNYILVDTVDSTCTERGWYEYNCEWCDSETLTPIFPKHTYGEWAEYLAPTCTEEGVERSYCTACDDETAYEEKSVAALGHTHESAVTDPTCVEGGYTTYTCHCGDTYVTDETVALGHTFGDWSVVTAPTCNDNGLEQRVCHCGEKEENVIPAGHDVAKEISTVIAPTCTSVGYTLVTCECCDYSRTENYVDMFPHSYGEWETVINATCTTEGFMVSYCTTGCGAFDTKVIPAAHDTKCEYVKETVAPTCTAKGYDVIGCTGCDYSRKENYVNALGHTYGDWETTTAPTCTSKGVSTRTCACGAYETKSIAKLAHTYGDWVTTKEPTCTSTGVSTKTCSCGAYQTKTIAKLAHTYGEWVETVAPTCTATGLKVKSCSCGASISETLEMLPHTYVETIVAPTDTRTGYTLHACECGDSYKDTFVSTVGSAGLVFEDGKLVSAKDFDGEVLVVPYSKDGVNITTIGAQTFINCDGIGEVYLTTNITSIEDAAFAYSDYIVVIYYEGTMAQWNAIEKGENWDAGLPSYTIECSDGVISVN